MQAQEQPSGASTATQWPPGGEEEGGGVVSDTYPCFHDTLWETSHVQDGLPKSMQLAPKKSRFQNYQRWLVLSAGQKLNLLSNLTMYKLDLTWNWQ